MEVPKTIILLNAISPLIVCIIATLFENPRRLANGFIVLFIITIATGLYAVISSLGHAVSRLVAVTVMGVFLLAPLVVPIADKIREKTYRRREMNTHVLNADQETGSMPIQNIKEEPQTVRQGFEVGAREEIGVQLMLIRLDFWLYFFTYFFGATVGLVYLNNLGQIAETRGASASTLVSLSSAFAFFGRLIPSRGQHQ